MRILIIEDEAQAAKRLAYLIADLDKAMVIVGQTDSVKRSVAWLQSNPAPDLIFMDIQLGDGLSFDIFEKVEVKSPVIFTTAYDEYALKAFKVNSIDYILKPVDKADLEVALLKLKNLAGSRQPSTAIIENIGRVVEQLTKKYKERFVVKVGEHLRTIDVSDILYLYSQEKTTFCVTQDSRHHILDFTLEQVADLVNPGEFFRISRKYLIHSRSIKDIISHSNSRLRLVLKTSTDTGIVVARERVQAFKGWLDQ
jgi:DNA-binding LytR/AlgR family response regulator